MAYDRYATRDRLKPIGARSFQQVRKASNYFAGQLRKVARVIGHIVETGMPEFAESVPDSTALGAAQQIVSNRRLEQSAASITEALNRYSQVIAPWAQATAEKMLHEVAKRDLNAWKEHSEEIGRLLRNEVETAPTGIAMRGLLAEQVNLITSLPTEAAQRVHDLTIEGLIKGERAHSIANKIMETGDVSRSRAELIAATEVSRTATTMTMVRAQALGSTHFEWVTSNDNSVRESHKVLNGLIFRWDTPPLCDPPDYHALPGCIWRCRCIPRVILPTNIFDSYRGRR